MSFVKKILGGIGKVLKTQATKAAKELVSAAVETILEEVMSPTPDESWRDDLFVISEPIEGLSPRWSLFYQDKHIAWLTERQHCKPTWRMERCPKEKWEVFCSEDKEQLYAKVKEWVREG